uniref:protocadherin Fat 4-like n=1 Tax=Myxine glutinosa TaxID=7769 RepID=UPI00358FCDC6
MVIVRVVLPLLVVAITLPASTAGRLVFRVSEELPAAILVGTVGGLAEGVGSGGVAFRFAEDHESLFVIDAISGDIRTNRPIDREALVAAGAAVRPSGEVVVDLVVLSGAASAAPIEVRVHITDVNDHAPAFSEDSVAVTFREEAAIGRRALLDTARDPDAGPNSVDHEAYAIVEGDHAASFRLEATLSPGGERAFLHLVTTTVLDREITSAYQLMVRAQDGGRPPRFGYMKVNISVLDTNDHVPAFERSLYETTVPEDVPVGTSLFTISATDLDADANGHVTYILSDFTSPFMVDAQGGIVRTRLPLDYEHRREYTVGLRATDGGSPPQSGRSGALVRVTDVNDNAPSVRFVFAPPGARHAAVDQGAPPGTVVALVTATDVDSDEANGFGPGRGPVLSIASGNEWAHFMLESSPAVQGLGLVKVAESFSRDAQLMYNLTLVASDRGSPLARSTSSHLLIIVRDPAKEALRPPPTFSKTMYKNRLPENAPIGSFVAAVSAHSEDGPLHYSVSGHSRVGGYFVVDRATGLVTTARELDCEAAAELTLNVSVRAQSGGPSAYIPVLLTVEDLNDNSPTFEEENREVVVEENVPAGTVVTWVIAHDSDKGLNGTVLYGLIPSDAGFHIDQASGKITTTRVLDREHIAYHELTVTAMDLGQPSRSAEAFLRVTIADVNDYAPVFRPSTYFTIVQPGAARGTFLMTVVAFDPDAGRNGTVLYGLSAPVGGHFEIETATGHISLREPLDHSKTYKLLVTARDEGGRDAEQPAEVIIYPVAHDYSLTFKQSIYAFAVFENAPVRTVLGQVSLTAGAPEGVSYYIFKGDPTGVFNVDPLSGMLLVAQPPDREAQETYRLTLVARRGLAAGETRINISIIDQNDHIPTFILPKDHVALDGESVPGRTVYRASASDLDPGPNGLISYSLKNNPSGLFHVDANTGLVTLVGHRWPGVSGTVVVEVIARDQGIPTLSSILTLKVSLPTKNEHAPMFEQQNYVADVSENIAINTRFLVVRATDPDDVGPVLFTLSSKSDRSGPIGLFPDGWLYIRSTLDRERQSKYDLSVLAYDSGKPSQSSTVTVHVHVIDENDNQPVFESAVYDFEVMEGGLAGSTIGRIHATDADEGAGGKVLYTLESLQSDFSLDIHSGLLSTQRSLDREAGSHSSVYSFIVLATDGGWPQALQGQARVRVHVMDKNDHSPVFSLHIYRVAISEGATMDTPVARLSASDADMGSNAVIQFSITSSDPAHAPFAIDTSTGQVKVAGPLDREVVEAYVLNVSAADQGQPQLSSTALILMSILDENDCDPIFQTVSFSTDIAEDARPGSLVVAVTAHDCDVGTNGELRYTLITKGGDPAHHLFHIDSATGHILLVRPLDFELQTEYRLKVIVEDSGRPSRTATASLLVRVVDVNDNTPVFLRSKVAFSIAEDSSIGMSVAAVSAQDSDTGPNGDLRYSLIQQIPPGKKFSIDPISGIVRVASPLDREGRGAGSFLLTVCVTDQALQVFTRLSAITNITVTLTDVNDNRPVFVSPPAFRLRAARSGAVLAALSAHDADSGHNGDIRYNLRAPGDDDVAYFSLDSFTGALHLTMASTLQIGRPVLEVEVTASDRGSPSMPPAQIRLAVILSPSTYGPPIHFRTSVQEEQPAGTLLIFLAEQAGARAGDIMREVTVRPGSASIMTEYYLTAAHSVDGRLSAHLFRLERHNGRLETAVSLDRDDGDEHFELEICVLSYTASIPAIVHTIQSSRKLWRNISPPRHWMQAHRVCLYSIL